MFAGAAAEVRIFDFAQSLAQRVEGQFRRHWAFVPALFNLYFREQVNTGASLRVSGQHASNCPAPHVEGDAAAAAASLYQKLHTGTYEDASGKRRRIEGDMSKLAYSQDLSGMQRRLLADFRFRTRTIPGTMEIRRKIGHVGFWASVVYGNGIFMTISPGERHNYLAIRLSRYRVNDPFILHSQQQESAWIGMNAPSLESRCDDKFGFEVPGYDMRRLIQARDPLCVVNAFAVQVRVVLASLLGLRLCLWCPHCANSDVPCQDNLGSNAEIMGGIAGRADAIFGATECQKVSGALHLHFWLYVQRLHQFHSLKEIAEQLEQGLVAASELKDFLSNLCCEEYSPVYHCTEAMSTMEKQWPQFREDQEGDKSAVPMWGDCKLGRLPPFIWSDIGVNYGTAWNAEQTESGNSWETLLVDARRYASHFDKVHYYFQIRSQHHIHPLAADGCRRVIPNACRSAGKPHECKHEAPWTKYLNCGDNASVFLVCKGLASSKEWRTSGIRNTIGRIALRRNNEWVNGTAKGLCVGFAGSNTDVQLNDLLPVLASTHETTLCRRNCVKTGKQALAKMTRLMQCVQSSRNGYFGGYISKRQPSGKLETRKCIDKMLSLRERIHGRSLGQQQRAVSGRMITDIETGGTCRGAVETFNLVRNMKKDDILFPECLRSFCTRDIDAAPWFHRLEIEMSGMRDAKYITFVPCASSPSTRLLVSKPSFVDLYAFRPFRHPWKLLSPFEFFQYWYCEPLLPPCDYISIGRNPRTTWTPAGAAAFAERRHLKTGVAYKPGRDFEVIEPTNSTYFTFPATPQKVYATFRHAWCLVRVCKPHVPVIEGVSLPRPGQISDHQWRYLSLFFRPWSLTNCCLDVPYLKHLCLTREHLSLIYMVKETVRTRMRGLQAPPGSVTTSGAVDFRKAWQSYVQGHIVSHHSRQLIQSVLLNTMARTESNEGVQVEADASDLDEEVPSLHVSAGDAGILLQGKLASADTVSNSQSKLRKHQHDASLRRCLELWNVKLPTRASSSLQLAGPMHLSAYTTHLKSRNATIPSSESVPGPYTGESAARAFLYPRDAVVSLDAWLANLKMEKLAPNTEQMEFIQHVAERVKIEAREEAACAAKTGRSEPLLDLLHGYPGTGKSKVLHWLRRLFEDALGWTHGVHFQYLAFQNAMASDIGGDTIHHWSGIPATGQPGSESTRDSNALSTKCQCLRFLVLDETSMVSAELLGVLEHVVSKVTRVRSGYKIRQDGSTRAFGGCNVVFSADWWQLPPVGGSALFSNPLSCSSASGRSAMNLFWGTGLDSIRHLWELKQLMRCQDKWYNQFLHCCRHGCLDLDLYSSFHGYPTSTPGSWCYTDRCTKCSCGHDVHTVKTLDGCTLHVKDSWRRLFLNGMSGRQLMECGHSGGSVGAASECHQCHACRSARCRVLPSGALLDNRLCEEPFASAPVVYSFNVPRYFAINCRAQQFAATKSLKLCWCIARDIPLHHEDRALDADQLHNKRLQWLLRHDQDTAHITSMLPLAVGLPMRLTESIDRKRRLLRGRCGKVVGWALHPNEDPLDVDGMLFFAASTSRDLC